MRSHKRLIDLTAATMSVAISLLAVPTVSQARELEPGQIDNNFLLVVGNTPVFYSNSDDVLGDGTVSFDPDTFTLEFKNATITKGYDHNGLTYGVYSFSGAPFKIKGNVTFSGLDVGMYFDKESDIMITDATIDIDCNCIGMTSSAFTFNNSEVMVKVNGSDKGDRPIGIEGSTSLVFDNSTIVSDTAFGGEEDASIVSAECVITNGSKVTAKGSTVGFWGGPLTLRDADLDLSGYYGAQCQELNLTDKVSVLNVNAKNLGSHNECAGIKTYGKTTISAGVVKVNSEYNGICSEDVLTISGADTSVTVNATMAALATDEKLVVKDVELITPADGKVGEYTVTDKDGKMASKVVLENKNATVSATPTPKGPKDGVIELPIIPITGTGKATSTPTPTPTKAPTATPKGGSLKDGVIELPLIPITGNHKKPTVTPVNDPNFEPELPPVGEDDEPELPPVGEDDEPELPPVGEDDEPATVPAVEMTTEEPTEAPANTADPKANIREFVDRIYKFVLDREPEADGADYWTDELYTFKRTGAEIAQGFIFSPEFEARNTTDEQFVSILYKTFFGRESEEDGMKYWLDNLANGTMDRATVANGFIFSQEWADTCAAYGIRSGGDLKPETYIAPTSSTYDFVRRMYTTALARDAEEGGLQFWAEQLSNFTVSGEQVGTYFFLSEEMESFNLDDREFVNRLYKTFMDRDADEDGAAYWLGVMASGTTRADVVMGFTRSPEFTTKCVEARILPY